MACNLEPPMDASEDVGAGLDMDSIKSSAELVAASWLDITGILLCSGEN